jgi:hypothetical protein
MTDKLSRRDLLERSAALGALAVFGATACNKPVPPLNCTDTTSLAPADAQLRAMLKYVDVSTQPGKTCSGCAQFIVGAPSACGTCKILKGPVNPGGNCSSFAAKVT